MIVIVGAGGHGQVVADIFRSRTSQGLASAHTAFVDDDPARGGAWDDGPELLGRIADLGTIPHLAVVVAIGDNVTRARVCRELARRGETFAVAEHPRSIVAADVVIGQGGMVCAGAVVNTGTTIGHSCIVNTGATVDHHTTIGDYVHIAPGVHMGGGVHVDDGALVGIGAVVLPGVRIGAWATVGAGAVVTRDVPSRTTVAGCPARPHPAAARV